MRRTLALLRAEVTYRTRFEYHVVRLPVNEHRERTTPCLP